METKKIGVKITEARKKMNLSQAQLAQHLFISQQAVGKWERGESLPDIIMLIRIAEILETDLNYFSDTFPTAAGGMFSDEQTKQPAVPSREKRKRALSWDMSLGNWADADFSGLKNLKEKFSSSNMLRCKFTGSDLSGLVLSGNNISACDFSDSWINGSRIQHSHLSGNEFTHCTLQETEFSGSHVSGSDFTDADFTDVTFRSGGFEKNTVTNAIWERTSFLGSYIADIVINGKVENCYFENCAFKRVTFQEAVLTNTFFKNKSLKQIRFIDCKADRMTYEFLKNGKANLEGIALLNETES